MSVKIQFRVKKLYSVLCCALMLTSYAVMAQQQWQINDFQGQDRLKNPSEDAFKKDLAGIQDIINPIDASIYEQDQSLKSLEKNFSVNKSLLRQRLNKYWEKPLLSNQSQWVSYSSDFLSRRVINFERNEINIALPGLLDQQDPDAFKSKAKEELSALVSITLKEALQSDPLFNGLGAEFQQDVLKHIDESLLLGELFDTDQKDSFDRLIGRLVQQMRTSFKTYRTQLGLQEKIIFEVPLPKDRLLKKAQQVYPSVDAFSNYFGLPNELVMAIIHTESHFNPLAVSSIPAYGLMQIVPWTAGKDAAKLLFDQPKLLSPNYLFVPNNNIQIGTAYLFLLYNHYLRHIENKESRYYCLIAAYNTGPVNVALAFTDKKSIQAASDIINQLSPSDVLKRLFSHLPSSETRNYLKKVLAKQNIYTAFDI